VEEINGFVAVAYDEMRWIGCVLDIDENDRNVKIDLLCPHGPSQSFKYLPKHNTIVANCSDWT